MLSLSLQSFVWITGIVLEFTLLGLMLKSRIRSRFPAFFTLLICQSIGDALLLFIYLQHRSPQSYFYMYWTSTAICTLASFFVIYEVFTYTLRPYAGLRDLARVVFQWIALLLLLVSSLVAFAKPVGVEALNFMLFNLNRSVLLLEVGLLVFLFLCSNHLGLDWKNFGFGIALGLGLTAGTNLVFSSLGSQLGQEWGGLLNLVSTGVSYLGIMLWIVYAKLPQPAQERIELAYRPAFDRWNQAALALSGQAAIAQPNDAATYLSDLERTVDQILNQSKPD